MADNLTTQNATGGTETLAASEDAGGVKASKQVSFTAAPTATLTRPANTTAYAAGDAITSATSSASAFTLTNVARITGGCFTIVDASLRVSDAASFPNLELFLFDTNPAIPNDNDAFTLSDAEMNNCIGVLNFWTSDLHVSNNNMIYHAVNPIRQMKCASGSTSIYGILKTLNGFTPISAETFKLVLNITQDT